MFENTLLIIKSDYMPRRKCLLLHLLSKGFQIQGNRKLAFTPEDAAEFYKDIADDKCYMLYVILLSKGTSEAFILTRLNAVEELLNLMICYFGTSVEMDRNIHVSRGNEAARREITFIFPNYIHEPIRCFDKHKFCNQPLMAAFLGEVYDIVQAPKTDTQENWRTKLSNWLIKTNVTLPHVSNQCSLRPQLGFQDRQQQTEPMKKKDFESAAPLTAHSPASSRESSALITSTSCVSCSSFGKEEKEICDIPPADLAEFEARLKLRATKTLIEPCKKSEETVQQICEEHIEWINVYEYEGDAEELDFEIERKGEQDVITEPEDIIQEAELAEIAADVSWAAMEEKAEEIETAGMPVTEEQAGETTVQPANKVTEQPVEEITKPADNVDSAAPEVSEAPDAIEVPPGEAPAAEKPEETTVPEIEPEPAETTEVAPPNEAEEPAEQN